MRKHFALALGIVMLAVPGQALAQSAAPVEVVVACEVKGHDTILYNRGAAPIAAGTVVHWSAWNGRREGDHTLEAPLEPFIGLPLPGALGASYFWDRPCEASIVAQAVEVPVPGPPVQDQDRRNGTIHLQGGRGNLPAGAVAQ